MRNTHQIIESQFPEYIRSDERYSKFIEFIVEYYKTIPNISVISERDIDSTVFINQFINEQAANFKELLGLSPKKQRLIVSKLIDLYKSKGSTESYKTLFNILFNIDIEVALPSEQIFKTSAAKWNRNVSIRFKILTGLLNSFENIIAKIKTDNDSINIDILKIVKVDNTTDTFEAFLALDYKLTLPNGGKLIADNFTGELVQGISTKSIKRAGARFNIGDVFDIRSPSGSGAKIKVTKLNKASGIKTLEIVLFGAGYVSSFISEIQPLIDNEIIPKNNLSIQLDSSPAINSFSENSIGEITDNLVISKYDYSTNANYFADNTYVGNILSETANQTSSVIEKSNSSALIQFDLGYVFEYPGYYSTNIGFTSDASYLQDGNYYQQFSYVIKSEKQYSEYSEPLKNLIHPAGLKSFGDYTINPKIDILISIINRLNKLEFILGDTVATSDKESKILMKSVNDTIKTVESVLMSISKPISDNITTADILSKISTKNITDTLATLDAIFIETTKRTEDFVSLFETIQKNLTKALDDSVISSDSGCIVLGEQYVGIEEGEYWEAGYLENETPID